MKLKMMKILQVLDRANCCCPLDYISLHTNIIQPLKILETLEEQGYVHRADTAKMSPSNHPLFKITSKGHQDLYRVDFESIKVPLVLVEKNLT